MNRIKVIYYYILLFTKYLPLLPYIFGVKSSVQEREEVDMYLKNLHVSYKGIVGLVVLLQSSLEFRTLVFFRNKSTYMTQVSKLYQLQYALHLHTVEGCGKNLMIWHGFSTIVNAQSIGDNCEIWQQVTIGNKFNVDGPRPIIGNNVKICAGSIIIGSVHIGDNAIIGAGSVVTRDVPSNSIVAGVPAKVIKQNK